MFDKVLNTFLLSISLLNMCLKHVQATYQFNILRLRQNYDQFYQKFYTYFCILNKTISKRLKYIYL